MEELRHLITDRLEQWQKLCEADPEIALRCAEEYRVSSIRSRSCAIIQALSHCKEQRLNSSRSSLVSRFVFMTPLVECSRHLRISYPRQASALGHLYAATFRVLLFSHFSRKTPFALPLGLRFPGPPHPHLLAVKAIRRASSYGSCSSQRCASLTMHYTCRVALVAGVHARSRIR